MHNDPPDGRVGYAVEVAGGLRCLARDLAGLEARGADAEALRRTGNDRANGLDVGVPAAAGAAVRVRDVVAEARPLAAYVADGSHGSLQSRRGSKAAHPAGSSRQRISNETPGREPAVNHRRSASVRSRFYPAPMTTVRDPLERVLGAKTAKALSDAFDQETVGD